MLSFIIIGRNEGWKLSKCLESVLNFVSYNNINKYEIIYVDSKSTDDSIERAKQFPNVKVFQITGKCNAAIGRNIGAKESKGDILFFIDGDMEIRSDFYKVAFKNENELIYPFLSGHTINYDYDSNWKFIEERNSWKGDLKDKYADTTGGIFIINRKLWDSVDGIKTKYKVNEDLDLGLRLTKIGFPLFRKKEIIAIHHTIPYNNLKRSWKMLLNGTDLYPMVLYRDHFFYLPNQKTFLFQNYTLISLLLCIFFYVTFENCYCFILYFFLLLFKSYRSIKKINFIFILSIFRYLFRDLLNFLAFFLFYPKKFEIKYKEI